MDLRRRSRFTAGWDRFLESVYEKAVFIELEKREWLADVGRRMWDCIDVPPEELIRQVIKATLTYAGNWGMVQRNGCVDRPDELG